MGGFKEDVINKFDLQAFEADAKQDEMEINHLRELCEERARQLSSAETDVRLLEDTVLGLTDRMKYYGHAITLEDMEHIMALTKTARRTLE